MNEKRIENDKVKRALIKARNAIRQKFRQLHNQRLSFAYHTNEEYKPITGHLKKLVEKTEPAPAAAAAAEAIKEENQAVKKEEPKSNPNLPRFVLDKSWPSTSTYKTAKANRRTKFAKLHSSKSSTENFYTPQQSETDEDEEEEGAAGGERAHISGIDEIEKSDDEDVNPLLLANNDEHTPRVQLNVFDAKSTERKLLRSVERNKDAKTLYGFRVVNNHLTLGKEIVTVSGNEPYLTYVVGGREFPITPGLTHLLTEEVPKEGSYNDNDVQVYKEMLMLTNAHRNGYNQSGHIRRHVATPKYNRIIKILFPPRRRNTVTGDGVANLTKRGGSCIKTPQMNYKTVNKVGRFNYTYWDDPNELVDRLRILVASKSVGHTGHENEMISIVEELREAKLIK